MNLLQSLLRLLSRLRLLITPWGLLLVVFFLLGLIGLIQRPERFMPPTRGKWASTNYMFLTATRAKLPVSPVAERMLKLLELSPPREGDAAPILAVGPANEPRFRQLHYLLGYVAWPRKVWALGCGDLGHPHEWLPGPPEFKRFSAVVLFMVPVPHWAPAGESVDLDLVVIPSMERSEWTSFCPL